MDSVEHPWGYLDHWANKKLSQTKTINDNDGHDTHCTKVHKISRFLVQSKKM